MPPIDKRRVNSLLDAIEEIFYTTIHTDSLEKILSLVLKYSVNLTNAEAGSILLYDKTRDDLYFALAIEKGLELVKQKDKFRIPRGKGICWKAINAGKIINVENAHTHPNYFDHIEKTIGYKIKTMLVIPLEYKSELFGVIEILNKKGKNKIFSGPDEYIISFLAHYASIAIMMYSYKEEALKKERLAAVGFAISGIAHYIKNVITGIRGSRDMLDKTINSNDIETARQVWHILKKNIDKLSKFSFALLRYSTAKKPEFKKLNLNEIIKRTVKDISEEIELKNENMIIKLSLDKNINEFYFCEESIVDIIYNLFDNSINAFDKKEELKIKIHTKLDKEKKLVFLIYEDNGPGIPKEKRKIVFEPFYSTIEKGSGIGLAIVKKEIEDHGGQIWIEDAHSFSTGTAFFMTLPFRQNL